MCPIMCMHYYLCILPKYIYIYIHVYKEKIGIRKQKGFLGLVGLVGAIWPSQTRRAGRRARVCGPAGPRGGDSTGNGVTGLGPRVRGKGVGLTSGD